MKKDPDDTRIALISNDITYIKSDISEIKGDIKGLDGHYVSQIQFKEVVEKLESLSTTFKDYMSRQNGFQRFVPAFISSVLTGIIVFLVISFLQNAR